MKNNPLKTKIFLRCFSILLLFWSFFVNVNADFIYESNNYTDYRFTETYKYDDWYEIKHFTKNADLTRNIGRTEIYKDWILLDYNDIVFFSTGNEYSYWDFFSNWRYSKITEIIRDNDSFEISYEYNSSSWINNYNWKTVFTIWKINIDDFNYSISTFWKPMHYLVKLNLFNNWKIVDNEIYYDDIWKSQSAKTRWWVYSTTYFRSWWCSLISIDDLQDKYKINYECIVKLYKTWSAAWSPASTNTQKIYPSFELNKERYNLCNYHNKYCSESVQIPLPTNLKQYIKSPLLEKEEIELWSSIGKFQSWSWIILEASIQNDTTTKYNMVFEVYRKWEKTPLYTDSIELISWTWTTIVPYIWEWNYIWKAKITDNNWNESEVVDYVTNQTWEIDFSLFEWFEPYPYGFNFVNWSPATWILTWTYDIKFTYNKPFYKISEDDWRKWKIFDKAFDTRAWTWFEKWEIKRIRAYESLWLNNDITFINNGSCFWLSTLSLLKYQDDYFKSKNIPNYLEQNHNRLYTKIKNGNIYDLISNPSSDLNQNWDLYSDDLEDIFAFHLSQYNKNNYQLNNDWIPKNIIWIHTLNPNKILETLKNNPDKKYILNFEWKKSDWKLTWHSVIPYRIEWNRIYIYDNVVKFPFFNSEEYWELKSYEQYIEINDWNIEITSRQDANETSLTLIWLMDIEEVNNNWNKSFPIWFNVVDILYTFKWDSDFLLKDKDGNKVWYKDWNIFEEIPWARLLVPLNGDLEQNNWKQIYLPQKLENLSIEINGKAEEKYDIMIAWWDYYTKLEWISTSLWQTDTFNISRENIKIDFDDNKTENNSYNILVDDFQNNSTWSIYIHQLETIKENQNFDINWNKVINEEDNSISYSIDTNNDWLYDIQSYFNSLPKSENETWSISWYLKWINSPWNSNMAWWKIYIDSNNDWKLQENQESFVVTDNNWYYEFKDLERWNYSIKIVMKPNWEQEKPTNNYFEIKLNNWQNIVNLDFKNKFLKWNNKK